MFDAYTGTYNYICNTIFYISECCKPFAWRPSNTARFDAQHSYASTCIGAVLFTTEGGFMDFWWPEWPIMHHTHQLMRKDMFHWIQTTQILASKPGLSRRVRWFKCINKVKTYEMSCSGRATGCISQILCLSHKMSPSLGPGILLVHFTNKGEHYWC